MKDFLNLYDITRNAIKGDRPAKEAGEKPILRGFIAREPSGYNSMSVQKFMDEFKNAETKERTLAKKEREEAENADEYLEKHQKEIDVYKELKSFNDDIKKTMQKINEVSKDDSLSPSEKRKELRDLRKEMTDTAREALEAVKDY